MEFEAFFLTVIAANAMILSVLSISASMAGVSGWWGWRMGYAIALLLQVRVLSFLGKPMVNEGPSAFEVFPAHFAVLFWMLAGSVVLIACSLRCRPNPEPTLGGRRLLSLYGAAQLFLFLATAVFAGYGSMLILQQPAAYGFSDVVIM